MVKKVLRYIFFSLLGIVAFLLIFVLISVAPVDRTPASELPATRAMLEGLKKLDIDIAESGQNFLAGFGKSNITPPEPVAMAGYGKRKGRPYLVIHDSIYVRAMVITNGAEKVAIVSADLLIIPPTVTRVLDEKLASIGFSLDNTYLGATHTHNSIGHWGEGATCLIYGEYDDAVVELIAEGIVHSIAEADRSLLAAVLRSGSVSIPQAVENRLIDGGEEDPYLRALEVRRSDSTKAVLVTYAAHATCLSTGTYELSRDYPGMVVDVLEDGDYDFAMFLAGAVGSHKGAAPENDWTCVSWMAREITEEFLAHRDHLQVISGSSLVMQRIPLALGNPQVKIGEEWKLRSWVFRSAFGEYDAFLTALRIGDVVMLGTPCDFSGEFSASLNLAADSVSMKAMVTSFNGGYIGYVTPQKYYDLEHYETRLMNWYAPGTGEYIRECLEKLMVAVSDTR